MFVPRYNEQEAREAIANSYSYAEALRELGLRPTGGNHRLFRRYIDEVWRIPTAHFDRNRAQRLTARSRVTPLDEVLVEHSGYKRGSLKSRLFEAGLKPRHCELCGQGETWRGAHMSLILDHINGVPDDNRLENLRIACPNCAATFDTHCGRKNRVQIEPGTCALCGRPFVPGRPDQRYCSRRCGTRHGNRQRGPRLSTRKAIRPPLEILIAEVKSLGFCAVGRKYGVSDNAVRKWIRGYEEATGLASAEGN